MTFEIYFKELVRQALREELELAVNERPAAPEKAAEPQTVEFLSVEQVAEVCRVGVGAVRGWIRSGKLTATKVGRGYLISREALRRLLSGFGLVQAAPEPEDEARRILARIQGG